MTTMTHLNSSLNCFLNDILAATPEEAPAKKVIRPRFDIIENEKEFTLYADLPGMAKKDVSITVKEGVLTVSGEKLRAEATENYYRHYERNYGTFKRSFNLPDEIDSEAIAAEMQNGELIIRIPKTEKSEPKQIEISIS